MRKAIKPAILSLFIAAILLVVRFIAFGDSTLDIQIGSIWHVIAFDWRAVLFILIFAFFLGGAIGTRFRSYMFTLPLTALLLIFTKYLFF